VDEAKEQAHRIKQLHPLGFKNKLSYLFKYWTRSCETKWKLFNYIQTTQKSDLQVWKRSRL